MARFSDLLGGDDEDPTDGGAGEGGGDAAPAAPTAPTAPTAPAAPPATSTEEILARMARRAEAGGERAATAEPPPDRAAEPPSPHASEPSPGVGAAGHRSAFARLARESAEASGDEPEPVDDDPAGLAGLPRVDDDLLPRTKRGR